MEGEMVVSQVDTSVNPDALYPSVSPVQKKNQIGSDLPD